MDERKMEWIHLVKNFFLFKKLVINHLNMYWFFIIFNFLIILMVLNIVIFLFLIISKILILELKLSAKYIYI